jgi:cell division protein FtsQ
VAKLQQPQTLPIRKINALGTFAHVDEGALRKVVAGTVKGGFFGLNVNEIKSAVEALPWVAEAGVRRVWPDTLAISVTEQTAMATWAKGGLVNTAGELFKPQQSSYPQGLPLFVGPSGMERNMTEQYRKAQGLISEVGLGIDEFHMDARRALKLKLSNDIVLMLGREHTQSRLQRFVRVYPKVLATRAHEIERVDLRYSHGLAVAWRQPNNG